MLIIKADVMPLARDLSRMATQQVPFATAMAVNAVGKRIMERESEGVRDTFDRPRKFSERAFSMARAFGGMFATKALPIAIIVAKPIQAAYLSPSEQPKVPQALGKGRKIRTPVMIRTDVAGNIPRGKISAMLHGRTNTFIGVVKGINGLWQRPKRGNRRGGAYGTKGKHSKVGGFNTTLKLLVAFTRPKYVKTDLHFAERAQHAVNELWAAEFDKALGKALETAK